jgi:prepilin-type processing-associated H-X9-DG protein
LSWPIENAGMPAMAGRSDYAANGGDLSTPSPIVPIWVPIAISIDSTADADSPIPAGPMACSDGVVYGGSLVRVSDITDGTSHTYLAGEKNIATDWYTTGQDDGDNAAALVGDDNDIQRWTANLVGCPDHWTPPEEPPARWVWNVVYLPPQGDTPGVMYESSFGSAHNHGFHMAFCDGSVRTISYSIDRETHYRLGNHADGKTIDARSF